MIFAVCVDHIKPVDKTKVTRLTLVRKASGRKNQSQHVHDLIGTIDTNEYILNVGTLAPEKNLPTLIRAWEVLNFQHKRSLKLVIVNEGEKPSAELEHCMRQHINEGNLIYLSKISDVEKSFLYSNARLFVSPAYAACNSSHLFSAMHYACPVVVSDIATHRWLMADAAWYCDPHSENSLAESIAMLLYKEHAENLRESLISKGLNRVKLFSHDKLAKQWVNLFEKMKVVNVG